MRPRSSPHSASAPTAMTPRSESASDHARGCLVEPHFSVHRRLLHRLQSSLLEEGCHKSPRPRRKRCACAAVQDDNRCVHIRSENVTRAHASRQSIRAKTKISSGGKHLLCPAHFLEMTCCTFRLCPSECLCLLGRTPPSPSAPSRGIERRGFQSGDFYLRAVVSRLFHLRILVRTCRHTSFVKATFTSNIHSFQFRVIEV